MNRTKKMQTIKGLALGALVVVMISSPLYANALAGPTTASKSESARLSAIILKGNQEITRRITTMNALTTKLNNATKISAADMVTLTNEVNVTMSGLTTLKTQLDSETTLASARTDVADIYTEYRVYAVVAPKISLIKVADDQQVVQGKLSALAIKLQARITADQQAGKDVAALQSQLTDMTAKTTAGQSISSSIELSVIGLQPSDYNANHAVLSGDRAQLKTAHVNNAAAYADAKAIIAGLKSL
ncbi:MAG: hypothetical protein ABI303_01130 [Candidatus Saccharimonas sp.]